jgi:hypothetical protein
MNIHEISKVINDINARNRISNLSVDGTALSDS